MENSLHFEKDKKHISLEKRKARELRRSQWWKNQIARGICYYCKGKFDPASLTMDHIVPIARGGKSTKGNTVPCCKECNNRKIYYTRAEILLNKLKKETKK